MKPGPFAYHCPTTVDDVVGTLAEIGDEAKILAGGQSLVPMLNLRLARFDHLIDIGRVPALQGIRHTNGSLLIGAATRDSVIEMDPDVAAGVPMLAAVTPLIGHFQIRNRGTIGGSLAHADPAAEYPAVALALDARIEAASVRGVRSIPASEFFTGVWSTALEPDELLRSITFPVWSGRHGAGVAEFARRHGDFAIAGAVVAIELTDADEVARSAIAMFGLNAAPIRAIAAEKMAAGSPVDALDAEEIGRVALDPVDDVTEDPQIPAAYRRRVGIAMVAQAWRRAVEDARRHR